MTYEQNKQEQDHNLGVLLLAMETSQETILQHNVETMREMAYLSLCHKALEAGNETGIYCLPTRDEQSLDQYIAATLEAQKKQKKKVAITYGVN